MIELLWNLLIIVTLILISTTYFWHACLDHRFPSKRPGNFSLFLNVSILVIITLASVNTYEQGKLELSSNLAMVVMGLLAAPAIAPPFYVDKKTHPDRIDRWLEGIKSRVTGFFAVKVIALIVAIVSSFFLSWYEVLAGICCIAIMAKSAALMSSDSILEGYPPKFIPPWLMKKWIIRGGTSLIAFSIIWAGCPYIILSETSTEPSSLFGFAGAGLSIFVTGFSD